MTTSDKPYWLRKAAVLVVLGLTVWLFPAVITTTQQLISGSSSLLTNGRAMAKVWRAERAGEAVLPRKVQAILVLLRENQISEFRYSAAIAHGPDGLMPQRLAEGAYPIRLSIKARDWVLSASEIPDAGCLTLGSREDVVLVRCP